MLHRFAAAQPDPPKSLHRPERRLTACARQLPSRLGPRSLPPPLFLERCVRAYLGPDSACRLLQLLTTYGHLTRALASSQGRRPRPPSSSDASRRPLSRLVRRGEPRIVRSIRSRCRFLPLARVCPTAIPNRPRRQAFRPAPASLRPRACDGDVHGSLDRAKDVSSSDRRSRSRVPSASSACALRMPTTFPSCGFQRTPRVAGASAHGGRDLRERYGPTELHVPPTVREDCRPPVGRGAFHRRVAMPREEDDSASRASRRPLAHAAHTLSPGWGRVLGWALQGRSEELRESDAPL